MKLLIQAVVLAIAIATPIACFAQAEEPLTRAQILVELIQLEQAGYRPAEWVDPNYPADIQAAETRVAAKNGKTNSVGGAVGSISASGAHADPGH
ncbi:DUF4148 domain-containing protein [Paraburkholderia sp. GAS82]|uniref:DUF4148 domain-containing protein n=1 Tax=Paraburkholderia sp. GAS82 TaxID=3035137 RepID=UPI003D191074